MMPARVTAPGRVVDFQPYGDLRRQLRAARELARHNERAWAAAVARGDRLETEKAQMVEAAWHERVKWGHAVVIALLIGAVL